ncbi:MAG TPA: magnesium transporter [Mycobacterium sp.]|nr:magnesium transporter [Mycobacterium sp.]
MLLLSRVTGEDVLGPDGRVIGRLADLTADLVEESGPHLVDRVVVKRRGTTLMVPWEAVANVGHNQLVLAVDATDTERYAVDDVDEALGDHEIMMARDVLDTQVVDVVGQRLARVADVVLARTPEGRLELLGVEVGFGGVLRRLRLPALVRSGEDIVAWSDLHLTSERGHAVQLATPRSAVHHLNARGLAELVSRVDTESATEILAVTGPDVAADVVRHAHPSVGERILRAMPDALAARVVAAMPPEHAPRWQELLKRRPGWHGRRFLRSHVWPRRRHRSGPAS